jgi:hypothetical protein
MKKRLSRIAVNTAAQCRMDARLDAMRYVVWEGKLKQQQMPSILVERRRKTGFMIVRELAGSTKQLVPPLLFKTAE